MAESASNSPDPQPSGMPGDGTSSLAQATPPQTPAPGAPGVPLTLSGLPTVAPSTPLPPIVDHRPAGPGQSLGPYLIEGILGEGGMGMVYRARHATLRRVVALKVMRPELAGSGEFAERFLREARAAAAINHPHVVTIHDAGIADGRLYMAFELVPGGDLAGLVKRSGGRLPEDRALDLLEQCAAGLAAVHAGGLVHRDIKPNNIFLDEHGRAKLGDLGLARTSGGDDRMTNTGVGIGTPAFMAPEQAEGLPDIDIRADIYALGATLFTVLSGRPPFAERTPLATMMAVVGKPAPDLRMLNPQVSAATAAVVARAMAKDRTQRQAHPQALVEDLRRLRLPRGDTAAAGAVALPAVPRQPRGRGLIIAGVVVVGLAAAAVLLLPGQAAPPLPSPAPVEQRPAGVQATTAAAGSAVVERERLGQPPAADQPLGPSRRAAYAQALAALVATAGEDDAQVQAWRRWTTALRDEETALRTRLAKPETAVGADAAGRRDLDRLGLIAGADDALVARWREALVAADRAQAALREPFRRMAADAVPGAASRRALRQALDRLAAAAGADDALVQDWSPRLAALDDEAQRLGTRLQNLLAVRQIPAGERARLAGEVERLRLLTADDDAVVVRWRERLGEQTAGAGDLRTRLKALDAPVPGLPLPGLRADLDRLRELTGPDDADERRHAQRLAELSDQALVLRSKLGALDAVAAPDAEAARDVDLLARLAGEQDADVARWKGRLTRIADLRRELVALDTGALVTPAAIAAASDLATLIGGGDRDLARWQVRISRAGALRTALAGLDRAQPPPATAGDDLAVLRTLVGDGDADVARWTARVARVAALRGALAPLDQAVPPPAGVAGDLAALRDLIGTADADLRRWQGKLAEIATRKQSLAGLDHGAAPADAVAGLARLRALVGSDDADVARWHRMLHLADEIAARIAALPGGVAQAPVADLASALAALPVGHDVSTQPVLRQARLRVLDAELRAGAPPAPGSKPEKLRYAPDADRQQTSAFVRFADGREELVGSAPWERSGATVNDRAARAALLARFTAHVQEPYDARVAALRAFATAQAVAIAELARLDREGAYAELRARLTPP